MSETSVDIDFNYIDEDERKLITIVLYRKRYINGN